jgi:aldose 1-epimerase
MEKFTLKNKSGMEVHILNLGGIISAIRVPDKNGNFANVVLGIDAPREYPYFGAIVGRYTNRIARGRFTLDGLNYQLAINNGPNALHGGLKGFDKVFWKVEEIKSENALKLSYTSPNGEEGYPGNVQSSVVYKLTQDHKLIIQYEATTDQATPINLTNHSYFNLSAAKDENIFNHILMINADTFTKVDENLIPTGEFEKVQDTSLDFRTPKAVGEMSYDHNYVLNQVDGSLKKIATVYEPETGRFMEVSTTEPGVQFYSDKKMALCLETQHFPDSPNHPHFPSTILRPKSKYESTTVYQFSVK